MTDQHHEILKLSEAMIGPLLDCPNNMSFSEKTRKASSTTLTESFE